MLEDWEKHACIDRCQSAPPRSRPELGPVPYGRLDFTVDLRIDPGLLKPFAKQYVLRESTSTTVIFLDDRYILKLLPQAHDVEETVAIMKLASVVIPVPHVYSYGYSGNCSFIFMQYINGHTLDHYIRKDGRHLSTHPHVLHYVDYIVHNLALLGISHNDLYPRNIIVDEQLCLLSVIDWDGAGPWHKSQEYINRVQCGALEDIGFLKYEPWTHDWDHIFRRYCSDVMDCLVTWANDSFDSRHDIRCNVSWTGFWRPDHWAGNAYRLALSRPSGNVRCGCMANEQDRSISSVSSLCAYLYGNSYQRLVNLGPFDR